MKKIIVFVKAPVEGKVKTRLCPPLSARQAADLYRSFAQDTLEFLREIPGVETEIAYEPSDDFPDTTWISEPQTPFFRQTGPDLGERLVHAFERSFSAGAKMTVIIGSDSPGLPLPFVIQAFGALVAHDVALGPARDGGYYLVGLKSPCPQIFRGISWSTPSVFSETVRAIETRDLSLHRLPEFSDVDSCDDFVRLKLLLKDQPGTKWRRTREQIGGLLNMR